jgi:hypothetical protein
MTARKKSTASKAGLKIKDLPVKELNRTLNIAKSLLYFPGADTTLTLRAEGNKLCISADSSGVRIRSTIQADVLGEGQVLLDMTRLYGLYLKEEVVSLTQKGKDEVDLRCGRSLYSLKTIEGDFHSVNVPKPTPGAIQINTADLKTALNRVWFPHEDDGSGDVRYILGKGIFMLETSDDWKGGFYRYPVKLWRASKKPHRITLKNRPLT